MGRRATDGDGVAVEVPGYHLRGQLERDGATTRYRAEAVGHPGRLVVIEHHRGQPEPAALRRIERAAAAVRDLEHPNVLTVLDVVVTDAGLAIVLPFCPGGSLAEVLERAPRGLPPTMVAGVGARLADGLAALHARGLVHGAISARSVRFDAWGRPLLVGSASVFHADMARPGGPSPTAGRAQPTAPGDRGEDVHALVSVLRAALAGAGSTEAGRHSPATATGTEGGGSDAPSLVPPTPGQLELGPAPTATGRRAAVAAIERVLAAETDRDLLDARRLAAALTGIEEEAAPADGGTMTAASPAAEDAERCTAPSTTAHGVAPASAPPGHVPAPSRQAVAERRGATPEVPTDDAAPAGREPHRRRRAAALAAAGLVLLVPVVLALTSLDGRRAGLAPQGVTPGASPRVPAGPSEPASSPPAADIPGAPAASTPPAAGTPGQPAATAPAPSSRGAAAAAPRELPPRCTGLQVPAGTGAVLLADLEGRGCSTPVRWDGRELVVASAGTATRRYELLADDGDQLLFGDLDCDGRDAPVLYRPASGELFVFDGLVAAGEEVTVTGRPAGGTGGRARLVTDGQGCDRLRIVGRR